MKKKEVMIHCVAPILIGAIFYYLFCPEVVFVKALQHMLPEIAFSVPLWIRDRILIEVLRNYFFDFLWGYAFMAAMYFVLGGGEKKRLIVPVFIFEIIMESVQMLPEVRGTFDPMDLVVEMISGAAFLGLMKHLQKMEEENEKN